jgi:hypothetical protein
MLKQDHETETQSKPMMAVQPKGAEVKHIQKVTPATKDTNTKTNQGTQAPRPGGGCIPIGD